jgi:eukaryotic-like serine/threonine-protein kinase
VAEQRSEELAGVREGQILAGKFRVERVLGVGGMGVVVAARHIELDSRVALKFLLPALLSNQEAVSRFAREARAAVRIQNEHVARVSDVGTLGNGAPYMVMEFLEGRDLSKWLEQQGPLSAEQAVDFVLQASVAVADAHSLGIIHRDLKPANLFCVRRSDGQFVIKVLDFGISKLTDAGRGSEPPRASVTQTAALMGSPLYMSPEQMRSAKDVDARTDIWALGIILFQLLAGRAPFFGETVTEVAVQVGSDPPPPLGGFRSDVPQGLEAVIFRCLEKDRRNRYANVAELALALLPFAPKRAKGLVERITGIIQAAGLWSSAPAVPPSPHPRQESLVGPGSVAPWSESRGAGASKKAIAGILVVLAALCTLGGGVIVRRSWTAKHLRDAGTGSALQSHGGTIDAAPHVADSSDVPEQLPPVPTTPEPATVAPPSPGSQSGHRSRVPTPPSTAPSASAQAGEAFLKLNSVPPSTCFLDGRELGSTPLPNVSVAPGTHIVKFVDFAQGRSKTISVTVGAGETKVAVATLDGPATQPAGLAEGATRTTSGPASKPECDPPYAFDAQGQKHFKPECYR